MLVLALLQPRVDEIADGIGNGRIFLVLGEHDRHVVLAQQGDELRRAERIVAHLHDVAQLAAVELVRQQRQEGAEVGGVELLGRRELPQDRPELVAQLGTPELTKRLMESPASASTLRLTA